MIYTAVLTVSATMFRTMRGANMWADPLERHYIENMEKMRAIRKQTGEMKITMAEDMELRKEDTMKFNKEAKEGMKEEIKHEVKEESRQS